MGQGKNKKTLLIVLMRSKEEYHWIYTVEIHNKIQQTKKEKCEVIQKKKNSDIKNHKNQMDKKLTFLSWLSYMPAECYFRYNYHDRIELTPRHGKPKFKKNWKFEKILEGKIKKRKKERERDRKFI